MVIQETIKQKDYTHYFLMDDFNLKISWFFLFHLTMFIATLRFLISKGFMYCLYQ